MQVYDLIMLIVLVGATLMGFRKGFAWQVASLASIFVSYIVAVQFRDQVAQKLSYGQPWNQFLAMLILYLGTSLAIWVGFRLVAGFLDQAKLKEFDHHLGGLLGAAKGVILCVIITLFAVSLLGAEQRQTIIDSKSGYYIASLLHKSKSIIPAEIHEVLDPYLHQLDQRLTPEDREKLDQGIWPNAVNSAANGNGGSVRAGGGGTTATTTTTPGANNEIRWPWSGGVQQTEQQVRQQVQQQVEQGVQQGLNQVQRQVEQRVQNWGERLQSAAGQAVESAEQSLPNWTGPGNGAGAVSGGSASGSPAAGAGRAPAPVRSTAWPRNLPSPEGTGTDGLRPRRADVEPSGWR